MATVKLDSGIEVTTFARAPRDFDPLLASNAELVRHGFPAKPDEEEHVQRFNKVLSQLKHKFHYIEPTFRVNHDRVHGPRQAPAAGTETSTNWSGAVVFAPAGASFRWVQGDWVVPDVDAPTQNRWYYCANWVGIDGDGSGDVCQAGVECEVYQSGSTISRHIYPWWEWYPLPEVQITNFPMNPGDMVTLLICTSGAGATQASAFFSNRTSGAATSLTFNAPSGTSLVGNCAEWIVEAPTVGGSQSALADYGEVFFSVCEGYLTNSVTVNGGTGDNINMTAGGSTVSDGVLITPTVVQCLYV